MSLYDKACSRCGSKEHASDDCPHEKGIFFNEKACRNCGSTDHASRDCPHEKGFFFKDTECSHCGSKEHSSKHCPHEKGLFFSEKNCKHCGSVDHASKECPHKRGLFESEKQCSHCGSLNHASSNCPHQFWKGKNGWGWLIVIVGAVLLILGLFSMPYLLLDQNFSPFGFNWLQNTSVWVFCVATWVMLYTLFPLIRAQMAANNAIGWKESITGQAKVPFSLFLSSSPVFIGFLITTYLPNAFIWMYGALIIILIGLLLYFLRGAPSLSYQAPILVLSAVLTIVFLWDQDLSFMVSSPKSEESTSSIEDESFNQFKKSHPCIWYNNDSVILIESTGVKRHRYFLPKGTKYVLDIAGGAAQIEREAEDRIYLHADPYQGKRLDEDGNETGYFSVLLPNQDTAYGISIVASFNDLLYDGLDDEIEIRYMKNLPEEFSRNSRSTLFMSHDNWQAVQRGLRRVEVTSQTSMDRLLLKEDNLMVKNIISAKQTFMKLLPKISEGMELDTFKIKTGDLNDDGRIDAVVYYTLNPTLEEDGGGGNAIGALPGLLALLNSPEGYRMADHTTDIPLLDLSSIKEGIIYLEGFDYADDDPRCCPSIRKTTRLMLEAGKITALDN